MSCFGPVLGWSEQSIDDDDHPSVSLRQVITHTWTGCLVSYIATTWHQCTVGWHTHIHLTSHFGLVYVELIYIASPVLCCRKLSPRYRHSVTSDWFNCNWWKDKDLLVILTQKLMTWLPPCTDLLIMKTVACFV